MNKADFTKQIIKHFQTESGLTIKEAKAKIKQKMVLDEYDNTLKTGNIKVFCTTNTKYCGGEKNGYGAGFYISNITLMGGSEIKLN